MRASLIIANYNSALYMESCLSSLQTELTMEDEFILIDNASDDGSMNIVERLWPGVKLISNPVNLGFAAACNQGAALARGEFLVFLNQDTRVEPDWLSGLLRAFDQFANVGLVTSKLLLMSQPGEIHMCGQDIHITGLTFGRGFLQSAAVFTLPEHVGAVSGASFAIRRSLWQHLGGFDANLFMYYEETDLCWRARLLGYESLYVPGSVVYHDYRLAQPGYLALYYSMRNRTILLLKSYRWQTLLLLSPSLLLAELLEWARALQIGSRGLKAKWKACLWLVAHPGVVIRSRRQVQKSRRLGDLSLLESCTTAITPLEFTGGKPGKVLAALCTRLFRLNAGITRKLLIVLQSS